MDVHHLNTIFRPHRIALLGISSNPNSVSGKVLINLVSGGFRGVVYPINSEYEAVMGIPCFPDIESLPKVPDLGIICTAPKSVLQAVRECGEKGIRGIIIMSAGFRETGEEGIKLEEEIRQEMIRFPGMRILGPNCLGVIVPGYGLNASFASSMPATGHIAFISQSGALCTSVLDWAKEGKIGFSYFVSIGNALDVEFGDLIDFFGEDEHTSCIMLYVESIRDARKFMTAARAFARKKPIIVYKAGRFPESAQVAASHTGAMASEDAVYDAAFQRAGLARVYEIGDIFNVAEIIGRSKFPTGSKLGIVTNAGGPGVMATDALMALKGELAILTEKTVDQLNQQLPPAWSHTNPVDVLGDARAKRISKAVKVVLEDEQVDAVLVILTPQAMTNPLAVAKEIALIAPVSRKPIFTAWMGGASMASSIELLASAGIPSFTTPEQAISAFMTLVAYSRNLKTLYETPRDIPVEFSVDRRTLHNHFIRRIKGKGPILQETLSKEILETYGIQTTRPMPASSAKKAVATAQETGYPVVLKIDSPEITHKSDVGGVILDLRDDTMVEDAFNRIVSDAKTKCPDANIKGVTVQRMVDLKEAAELILGIKKDPVFGTIMMVGMGGIFAELFQDKALGLPPLNEALARHLLESLKIWPVLNGYRGMPPKNVEMLIDMMIRISYLAADYPEITELDINPLIVTPNEVIALDARMVVDMDMQDEKVSEYHHLALHPYPEKYVKKQTLQDGSEITLRPIKPEDEPLWLELLGNCSKESLYSRFRYFFHWETHEIATRYCYIDYDREIAIVAEINDQGTRKLIGVGRLVADPDHEAVEYAILVVDAWQNRDVGNLITDYCLEIAGKWNPSRIYAQTTTDNHRMISMFKKRGFLMMHNQSDDLIEVEK
ncbi:MAG: bifunctional acetate--CoA ligase family protein/GNAT family N-acetyltransferase, partial [Bacteroidales bacterium]|nr:bifunctional acetate--CoA ligase family protein/GNAT family N-acetyltransferase [Bacteroidales bacterium]